MPGFTDGETPKLFNVRGKKVNLTAIAFSNDQLESSEAQDLLISYYHQSIKGSLGKGNDRIFPRYAGLQYSPYDHGITLWVVGLGEPFTSIINSPYKWVQLRVDCIFDDLIHWVADEAKRGRFFVGLTLDRVFINLEWSGTKTNSEPRFRVLVEAEYTGGDMINFLRKVQGRFASPYYNRMDSVHGNCILLVALNHMFGQLLAEYWMKLYYGSVRDTPGCSPFWLQNMYGESVVNLLANNTGSTLMVRAPRMKCLLVGLMDAMKERLTTDGMVIIFRASQLIPELDLPMTTPAPVLVQISAPGGTYAYAIAHAESEGTAGGLPPMPDEKIVNMSAYDSGHRGWALLLKIFMGFVQREVADIMLSPRDLPAHVQAWHRVGPLIDIAWERFNRNNTAINLLPNGPALTKVMGNGIRALALRRFIVQDVSLDLETVEPAAARKEATLACYAAAFKSYLEHQNTLLQKLYQASLEAPVSAE